MYQPYNEQQYAPAKVDRQRTPTRTQAYGLFLTVLVLNVIGQSVVTVLLAVITGQSATGSAPITMITVVLSEILFIALPVIVFCRAFGYDLRATLHLHPTTWKAAGLSILIAFLAWPLAVSLGKITEIVLGGLFGRLPDLVPPPKSGLEAILYLPVLALPAALCEELLNRGVLQRTFERQGWVRTVLVVGLFFGLFHLGLRPLLYTALLGGILAFVVYRTGSIFNSMLAHGFFNSISAVLLLVDYFGVTKSQPDATQGATELADLFPPTFLVLLAVATPLLYLALRALPRGPHSAEAENAEVNAGQQPAKPEPTSLTNSFGSELLMLVLIGLLFTALALAEVFLRLNPQLTSLRS